MCHKPYDDDDCEKNRFAIDRKIMIVAVASLFSVAIIVLLLHLYARFLLRRQARRRAIMHHQNLVARAISHDPPNTGLDPFVISSLPIFIYKQSNGSDDTSMECAVCLSTLEEEMMARLLPNCKHTFHAKCIDMWLKSNLTCPICRTGAEPKVYVDSGCAAVEEPSAPPLDSLDGEGTVSESSKANGSGSRLSSFRKMIGRERSERRVQPCEQGDGSEDPERA
eukprot:TRINITY_DN643_c0_g1_i1.p1 TRINITY_DN643_c0_g1~~TRINITY_DN643_c0_g1_i1.p1  ORF type:complete len:235 (+),score=18.73 TRINITY_DN643_c0_g1_i1:39-707(+)